jgi:hypothetical protein
MLKKEVKEGKRRKNLFWAAIKLLFWGIWLLFKWTGIGIYKLMMLFWMLLKLAFPSQKDKAVRKSRVKLNSPVVYNDFVVKTVVEGSYERFKDSLLGKSEIFLIFGKRGSGKSALGFRLLENIHAKTKRKSFVLGVSQSLLPKWLTQIEDFEKVTEGGVALVDEGAVTFSSRESMKKSHIELGKLLAIARHRDISVIFITQNTGMIDKNVLSLTDAILVKESSLLQKQMERPVVRTLITKVDLAMKQLPSEERVKYSYVFSDDFEGLTEVALPTFWSQTLSKSQIKA